MYNMLDKLPGRSSPICRGIITTYPSRCCCDTKIERDNSVSAKFNQKISTQVNAMALLVAVLHVGALHYHNVALLIYQSKYLDPPGQKMNNLHGAVSMSVHSLCLRQVEHVVGNAYAPRCPKKARLQQDPILVRCRCGTWGKSTK